MTVNKYYINIQKEEQMVDIPFELDWYFEGQEDAIEIFQTEAVREVIGTAKDFEVDRFAHNTYNGLKKQIFNPFTNTFINHFGECTDLNYEFYFFSGSPLNLTSPTDWANTYFALGFTTNEMYYNSNGFSKSFYKLDFYDLPDEKAQTNYFTIILPTQQGFTEVSNLSVAIGNVDVRKPKFKLDYLGDKEGFFIYWLKKTDFISADTFYMTAKFFDARNGFFIKMMNTPQSTLTIGGSQYSFKSEDYFYFKVKLNYSDRTYEIFDTGGVRVGTNLNPIKWYQYVNP